MTKGVTSRVSGSTGTAVTFNGSTGTIGSSQSYVNPRIYSEELWFTTTTTRGGKLIGFGNRQSGNSTSHDRDVYMLNSGQLVFGVNATPVTLTTPAAYNDGNWHHLVATAERCRDAPLRRRPAGRLERDDHRAELHRLLAGRR